MANAEERPLAWLESYVDLRAAGHGPAGGRLLDAFPLHVAIAACELFGAVAAFGRRVNLKRLTDEEWRQAGGTGFDIFAGGSSGVEAFLENLRDTYPYSRAGNEGPQALLGRIYQVLEFGREDIAYSHLLRPTEAVCAGAAAVLKPPGLRCIVSAKALAPWAWKRQLCSGLLHN